MKFVKKTVKNMLGNYRDWQYHRYSNKKAYKALKGVESQKSKTDSSLIKMSDEYAMDVFGWKGFSPWFYVYSAMSGTFKEGWIPDNYYGKIIVS